MFVFDIMQATRAHFRHFIKQARNHAEASLRKPRHQHHMPRRKETHTLLLANNKGTDQPVHLRSHISTFVISS